VLAQDEASTHGGNYGTGDIMAGVIRGGAAVADGALWALGVSVEAARWQLRLIKEVTSWAQQAPAGPVPVPPWPRTMPPPSLREALQRAGNHIDTGPMLPGLPRDGQAAAAHALMRLAADLSRVRQQVSELLHGVEADRAEPELAAELPGRVGKMEARLSVVERRVGTGPDVAELDRQIGHARRDRQAAAEAQDYENAAVLRDRERQLLAQKASRHDEWAAAHLDLPSLAEELARVRAEVGHLRGLLSQRHIQRQDGTA
jgi:hypothetical protein